MSEVPLYRLISNALLLGRAPAGRRPRGHHGVTDVDGKRAGIGAISPGGRKGATPPFRGKGEPFPREMEARPETEQCLQRYPEAVIMAYRGTSPIRKRPPP